MNFDYWPEGKLVSEIKSLIALDPSKEEERPKWEEIAIRIANQLNHIPDVERHPFHYVTYFVDDGNFFSRHPDFYESEKAKIKHMFAARGYGS